MIPFAIPLALKTLPWKWIGIGAGVIAVLLACWWVVDSIGDSREEKVRAEYEAAQRAAEAKAAADTKLLNDAIAEIDTSITVDLEAIRHVPRDKPRTIAIEVTRDLPCLHVPDRLLDATNEYTRNLATASGHRVEAVPAANPAK
jgi:hypothetical protein